MMAADCYIKVLRSENKELLGCLKDLIDTCPADPDTTKKFLRANQKAAALISKLSQP